MADIAQQDEAEDIPMWQPIWPQQQEQEEQEEHQFEFPQQDSLVQQSPRRGALSTHSHNLQQARRRRQTQFVVTCVID